MSGGGNFTNFITWSEGIVERYAGPSMFSNSSTHCFPWHIDRGSDWWYSCHISLHVCHLTQLNSKVCKIQKASHYKHLRVAQRKEKTSHLCWYFPGVTFCILTTLKTSSSTGVCIIVMDPVSHEFYSQPLSYWFVFPFVFVPQHKFPNIILCPWTQHFTSLLWCVLMCPCIQKTYIWLVKKLKVWWSS